MYVIFPADEVVYLSYGRLIVVPPNSTPESSNSPIRTNSLSPERTARDLELATNGTTSELEEKAIIEGQSGKNQPSTSKQIELNEQQTTTKPKKRSLRLNFSLLRRSSSKTEPQQSSSRVRYSVGHKDQSGIVTPPSEAFKKFCNISSREPTTPLPPRRPSREKSPLDLGLNGHQDKTSIGKRSSSSSKTSKPEEQSSKRSSKHSSSSSKSTPRPEKNPSPLSNHTGVFKRSQSQIQRDALSRKASTSNSLTAEAAFYPLSTSREKNLVEPSPEPVSRFRSSSFRLRRSKTPECQPARPERKKEKKITKPKPGLERKLSFSDYLAVSREKCTDDRARPLGSSDRDIAREKSPVLSFFRKTPSPKNLGRDRTPYLSREGLHSNLVHETQFEDIPRPPNTGQKHTSGEGSIMRVAIFTTTNY